MKTRNTFAFLWFCCSVAAGSAPAALNEWTFENDAAGLMLSQAVDSGTDHAVFAAGGAGFLETDGDGRLVCRHVDEGVTNGMWFSGAILDADVANAASGVHYLRYDFNYDLSEPERVNGSVLGLSFIDSSGTNIAGLVFLYDRGNTNIPVPYRTVSLAEDLSLRGKVSAIAKVDMDTHTMAVWYDLTGANRFNESLPATSNIPVRLTSIDKLRFQATGDFRSGGSTDYAAVDNIRTASTWAEIVSGPAASVDASTLSNKVMCGYQGWFTADGDGGLNGWRHWSTNGVIPNGSNLSVDMYPDLSEFSSNELFATAMTKNGNPAYLYSGRTYATVNRHVRWMKEYGIDGIFAQRFVAVLTSAKYTAHMNAVRTNLQASCEEYRRIFAIMYDVSGANESNFWDVMRNDWISLVDSGMTDSPMYLKHNGKPVLGIWGFGFKDGVHPPTNAADAQTIINWFHTNAPEKYRATLVGGVPTYWKTLIEDSRPAPAWAAVYRSFDIISPWMVGRYRDQDGADSWKNNQLIPDIAEAQSYGKEYLPVIWPGTSWHNLQINHPENNNQTNFIPRQGGAFYWRQAYNAVSAEGVRMIYIAMFDEVDESTAIYKLARTASDAPDQGYWLTLDADGYSLPSDWYLRLADETGRMLRRETPVTATMPADPGPHYTARGTPLTWLESNGLTKNGYENADVSDTDQDGMQAWAEYITGTMPTNSSSLFSITAFSVNSGNAAVISWPSAAGRQYSVYMATNLSGGVTNLSGFTGVPGVSGTMSCTNTTPGAGAKFYRVKVNLNP